jgi:hypothetical protein
MAITKKRFYVRTDIALDMPGRNRCDCACGSRRCQGVSDALGRDRGVVDRRHFVVVFSRDHGAPFMLLSLTTALGKSGSSRKNVQHLDGSGSRAEDQ